MNTTLHLFRSATSITSYCGDGIERPDPDHPRTEAQMWDRIIHPDCCSACLTQVRKMENLFDKPIANTGA